MAQTLEKHTLDIQKIRTQFPVLHQEVNGKPLIYFDNAATNQKPKRVIDALVKYYEHDNANIHRGAHALAARATEAFENTRVSVQKFINANEPEEIIFTKHKSSRFKLGSKVFEPRRRSFDFNLRASLQHCALANDLRRARSRT